MCRQPIGGEPFVPRDGIRNSFNLFSFLADFRDFRIQPSLISLGSSASVSAWDWRCLNGPLADEVRTRQLQLE